MRAFNSHGVPSTRDAVFGFYLQPYFYQTKPFYSFCALLALGAGWGFHRSRLRHQRVLHALEQGIELDKERSRIARDLHDDLGTAMAQVALINDLAMPGEESRVRTRRVTREMMQKLDEIVWALNPAKANSEAVVTYLIGFAEEFAGVASMTLHVTAPSQLPRFELSAPQRHNLFLALKEMLHNAVSHSQGTGIELEIRVDEGRFRLSVTDNGVGFDPASVSNHWAAF